MQADRAPDKLPSLAQQTLTQAKGPAPEPLSAAEDHSVKTDGDLRKLLLKRPSGAQDPENTVGSDGWLDVAGYAELFTEPDEALGYQIREEFRRAAVTNWSQGTLDVAVTLVQYRQEVNLGASDAASDGYYYADDTAGTHSWAIPGTGDGMAYVHGEEYDEYSAEAHAWRGDVAMEIWLYDIKPIPKKTIMDLAERQMERL